MTTTRTQPHFTTPRKEKHVARRSRVLLAEDDDEMRSLLEGALLKKGHEVVSICSGLRLIAEVESSGRQGDPVDLVITDVRMPEVSGLEALEWLRELGYHAPTLVITAFGDPSTHAAAQRLGAKAVLDKPFDLDVLLQLVAEVLECPE